MGLDTRKREVELILERLVPRVIHELLDPQSHRDTDQLYRRAVGLVVKALLSQVEPDEAPGPLPGAINGSFIPYGNGTTNRAADSCRGG